MKRFFAFCLLTFLIAGAAQAQTKRALIIAIGAYPEPQTNGWPELSSLNDVPMIQAALEKQNFSPGNIWTLLDEQATKDGIEKALDRLIDSAKTGDIIVIHISSHGEQIEDDNVSEEQDGLDETIVPYGAIFSIDKSLFNKVSAGYLRDDTFGEKITRLRNKVKGSGDILVTLDACHSGSGTRAGQTTRARGSKEPMVSATFDRKKMTQKDAAGVFKDNNSTALSKDAATYVVISGAQAQERNYECLDDEGRLMGSLSYAISKAISTLEDKITYRTLFARIVDVMREKAPNQKPVLEGDGLDRELFGGRYVRQKPYITIDVKSSNKDTLILTAGTITGVTPGSVISFYQSGTNDPANAEPLAKGTVVAASNFSSAVKLEKENEGFLKNVPWAFLTEMNYGSAPIKLGADALDDNGRNQLKQALKDFGKVEFRSDYELYVDKNETGGWALKYANTGVDFEKNLNLNSAAHLKEVFKRYDRYRYLKDLKITEKDLTAKVELVFLTPKGNIDLAKLKSRTKFGRLELRENDTVYLKIKNTGNKNFYINIVDIQPDGIINRILPNRTLKDIKGLPRPILPENCMVKRKDSVMYKDMMIVIAPPTGEEIFKVFLSTQQLDLEEILVSNTDEGSRSRGALNNLAKIFKESNNLGTRGGNTTVKTADDGTIFSLNFTILPEQ
jgi:metacaspase-1